MKRLVGLSMFVVFFAVSVGGCACGQKKVEAEPAPVQTVERTPAPQPLPPAKPAPVVKKGRN